MNFTLSGTDNSFTSKTKDIFASLDAIEAKHNAVQKTIKEDTSLFNDDPKPEGVDWKRTPNDNQGFKRPGLPAPRSRSPINKKQRNQGAPQPGQGHYRGRGRRAPDHKSNPDRWTRYDLSDVPELTDRSNSRAALSFLSELRNRDMDTEEPEGAEIGKHLFKPPTARPTPITPTGGAIIPSFGPSKRVLPEYVVGRGSGGAPKARAVAVAAEGGAIDLGHLDDIEGDDIMSGSVNIPDPALLFASFKDDHDETPTTFNKKSKSRQTRKRNNEEDENDEEDEDDTPIFRSKSKKSRGGIKSNKKDKPAENAEDDSDSDDDWEDLEALKKQASDDELNQVD